jgi:AcrR family transcriptional regulator
VKGKYNRHRSNQEEAILHVAGDLFISKGIENVKMNDIAREARLTKPTLYKYFRSKEEVAIRIFQRVTRNWEEKNRTEVWNAQGNGFFLIERFVNHHFDHLLKNIQEAGFLVEFDLLYAKKWSVEEGMKIIGVHLEEDHKNLLRVVSLGQSDGSVRSDLDRDMIVAGIFNFNSGMMIRLGMFGKKLEQEYNTDLSSLFRDLCRIFLDGLRPLEK